MEILILNWRDIKHPEAGGAEVHLHEIFGRMAAKGHNVYLLTTGFRGCRRRDKIDGIHILRWGHKYIFNWESPWFIRKLLKKQSFDCIIDDVNKIPFFSPKWFKNITTCVFFHHLLGDTIFELTIFPCTYYVLFLEKLSGWAYRSVQCCTVSESTKEELVREGFHRNNIEIIGNSVDTKLYYSTKSTVKEDNLLLYIGRLKKYKNIGMLIDVVSLLLKKGRVIRLSIVGSGDDETNLKKRVKNLGISNHVDFLGFITGKEKVNLYRKATIFVNPSIKEGWGITSIEANACGTAVIANNVPGLCESVKHEVTGLLFKRNDPIDLMKCIENLLDNPEKRNLLEKQGIECASTFSWDNSAQKVENWLLEKVLKK